MMLVNFKPVLDAGTKLGESPVWSDRRQALFFVDISGRLLHRYEPGTRAHEFISIDEDIGCVAPASDGGFVAGLRSGIWRLDHAGRKLRKIATNPEDIRTSRFNDGRIDPRGRLLAGTIDEPKASAAACLYRLDGTSLSILATGLMTSNGLAFSPDGHTLYHSDTPRFVIYKYDYDPATGAAENRTVFAQLEPTAADRGRPDGAAVDVDGCYWTALYEGARVRRYDPDGRVMADYPVPAKYPTMVAFGGADRRTLFLTTANGGGGGALYAADIDVRGLVSPEFASEDEPR
jgi:sugar lactone lactonase YvrE